MIDFLRNLTKSTEEKRQERLNAYLDGALSAQERRQFEQELDGDADLRAELEQLRWVKLSVQKLPRVRAPRNFVLDPAVYGQKSPSPAGWSLYPSLRVATALTAFLFVLALALDVATPYGVLRQPLAGMSEPQTVADQAPQQVDDAFATAEMEVAAEEPREEAAGDEGAAEMMPFAATEATEAEEDGEAAMAVEEAAEGMEEAAEAPVEEPQPEEEAAAETAADRVPQEAETVPAPAAAAPAESTAEGTTPAETAAMPSPQATLGTESEPAPQLALTEAPPEVAAAESADADAADATPAGFPYLLAIEIVLAVALVVLFTTTLLMRRMT